MYLKMCRSIVLSSLIFFFGCASTSTAKRTKLAGHSVSTDDRLLTHQVVYVVFSHGDGWALEGEGWRELMFFGDVTLIEAYQAKLGQGQEVLFKFYLSTPSKDGLDHIGSSLVVGGESSSNTLLPAGVTINKMPPSIYDVLNGLELRPLRSEEVTAAIDGLRQEVTVPSNIAGLVVISSRANNVDLNSQDLQFLGDALKILALSGDFSKVEGDFTVVKKGGSRGELWFRNIAATLHTLRVQQH